MRRFGLTGNMGCGKSTVASLLALHAEVLVLDCDRIAKEILLDVRHAQEVCRVVGTDVCSDGAVNTQAVAQVIFNDASKKAALEAYLHPFVWNTIDTALSQSNARLSIVESAILYEIGDACRFDGIIVATCSEQEQLRRLREHRRMTEGNIMCRLAWQWSSAEKERLADFAINTECSMQQLGDRVDRLYQNLMR